MLTVSPSISPLSYKLSTRLSDLKETLRIISIFLFATSVAAFGGTIAGFDIATGGAEVVLGSFFCCGFETAFEGLVFCCFEATTEVFSFSVDWKTGEDSFVTTAIEVFSLSFSFI